jgi:hypothetical protein
MNGRTTAQPEPDTRLNEGFPSFPKNSPTHLFRHYPSFEWIYASWDNGSGPISDRR